MLVNFKVIKGKKKKKERERDRETSSTINYVTLETDKSVEENRKLRKDSRCKNLV